ncbi:hypothetical protein [Segatella buccae]|jgi:hypothetical protein|nr:hypothetical protein [Segatella buccae]
MLEMNQAKLEKRAYICPTVENIYVEVESLLTDASGDHVHIGQGGTYGDAKQGFFFDEEEEKTKPRHTNAWED